MMDILLNNKNRKEDKGKAVLFLSFILPLILMLAIIISKKVFPFGDRCILRTDFYHQYLPFHAELQYKLKNFKSLFYTYSVGLGTNFITVIAYYLMCPFNLLLFFVDENLIIEYITLIVVLKISFAGLCMGYYLRKKYDTDNYSVAIFALLYALSGYVGAYYWNIMWLDNILLFPLLMFGFEKMFNGGKPYVYIVTLAGSILCNYYIGTITCFFLIIYFIFYSVLSNKKIKEIGIAFIRTGIYSLISILISAIILVPTICAFKTTASSDISLPKKMTEYFTIVEVLGRHLPFVTVENGIEYWPNLYCGMICFFLFTLYLLSKKYKIKEKICYTVLFIFFIASFSINVLDFAWHVFKYPNSLPCRQSFIYTFLLLTICMKPLLKINSIKVKEIAISFSIPIMIIILFAKDAMNEKMDFVSIYSAIILLFIYFILFLCYKNKKYNKNLIIYIAIIAVSMEVFLNMYHTSITTINRNDYLKNVKSIKKVTREINNITDDFYRVERAIMKTKDDGAFMHFPSASIFSSSAYSDGSDFYKSFGMEASTNAYSETGSTPFADSLLSVKYKLFESEEKNAKELNKRIVSNDGDVYLYQNLDTLPFSYVLHDSFLNDFDKTSGNPATVQNNFSRTLELGTMLDKKNINISGREANYTTTDAGDYYVFVRDKGIKEVTVTFPTTTKTFKNLNRGYFIELGYIDENVRLEFRNDTNDDELLMELFSFKFDVLKKVVDKVNDNFEYKMKKFSEDYINYTMNSKIDGVCLATLPYDKGFTVYVDGNVVETKKVMDFFLGFDIERGEHDIVLKFRPIGLDMGIGLTILGLVILLLLIYIDKKKIFANSKLSTFF